MKKFFLLVFLSLFASTTAVYAKPLATFSTNFNASNEARANNIKISSNSVNGTILEPGEIFSFNKAVGPTIESRGYQAAVIFVDGQEKKGFGGGVCQTSSTIYNAAQMAGLEITERHPHSKKVHYVGDNQDAATSYGVIDLKFKNTKNFPVKINSYVKGDGVHVEIVSLG